MMLQVVFVSLLGLSSALVCPDGGMCEDKNTCCKNSAGGYGCCPLPHAECCSDHLHCCYEGTTCDLAHAKCVNKTVALPWVRRVQTKPVPQLKAVICPDQEFECPDETTCCQLLDGSWGCCPLAKAVCCEDRLHCCPEGTKCDLVHSKCTSSSLSVPMMTKLPATRRENAVSVRSVVCPDRKSSCPDSFTCCLLTTGEYGCCPYPEAMCCSDHLHCCPENTICDLEHGVCKSGETKLPMMKKVAAAAAMAMASANDVVCPDQQTVCPDETTCCEMTDETYGCCPMPNAVCCSDHVHCCPAGTKCDIAKSMCTATGQTDMITAITTITTITAAAKTTPEPVELQNKAVSVPCNDSVACADGTTCCRSAEGHWACCPLPEAVCCEDQQHCCPHGTVCNLAESTCDDAAGVALTTLHAKTPVLRINDDNNNKCDEKTTCPEKTTCCKLEGGAWACCPLPQAVCCEDHVHCCPHGTVCNLEAETCDDVTGAEPPKRWAEKRPALTSRMEEQEEVQPSVKFKQDAEWGEELPPWVTLQQEEVQPSVMSRMEEQEEEVQPSIEEEEAEKCDKETMCPGGTTCCRKGSADWACCPLPQAVCCSDHEHCCPKGYKCNLSEQSCDHPGAPGGPSLQSAWLQKFPALQRARGLQKDPEVARPARTMCDGRTSCPKDTTCCFMAESRRWGCCPLPQAICCGDGNHCCPRGHTCEPGRSSCSRGPHLEIPWFRKISAVTVSDTDADAGPVAVGDVKCDDKSSCATGTTCCKLQTGEWGCCPLVKAVCCADRQHCCPQGYSCNMETGTCEKKSSTQVFLTPLTPVVRSSLTPVVRSSLTPLTPVVRSSLTPVVRSVVRSSGDGEDVPCDSSGEFKCSERDTCCKVSATEWACCPSPRAVCCSDSRHCCPAGFACDLEAGGCTQTGTPQSQTRTRTQTRTWDFMSWERKKDQVQHGL